MSFRNLFVRRGDPVLPAVNELSRLQKSLRILSGRGILLGRGPQGVRINARAAVVGFTGSFAVRKSGKGATFGAGYVNGLMPVLDGLPIVGTDKKAAPILKLRVDEFDGTGRSWLCLKATIDKESGRIIQPKEGEGGSPELTIVQRKSNSAGDTDDDAIGYHAIAVLFRGENDRQGLGDVHQIALHDYQHKTARQDGRWRHFFSPA